MHAILNISETSDRTKLSEMADRTIQMGDPPPASRVEAIRTLKRPTTVKYLRRFLGTLNYYCRFTLKLTRHLSDVEIWWLKHRCSFISHRVHHKQLSPLMLDNHSIYCDTSKAVVKPFVPGTLHKTTHYHCAYRSLLTATCKIINERFIWPNMHRDVRLWPRISYQWSKGIPRITSSSLRCPINVSSPWDL